MSRVERRGGTIGRVHPHLEIKSSSGPRGRLPLVPSGIAATAFAGAAGEHLKGDRCRAAARPMMRVPSQQYLAQLIYDLKNANPARG